jgi:hypothetical protein
MPLLVPGWYGRSSRLATTPSREVPARASHFLPTSTSGDNWSDLFPCGGQMGRFEGDVKLDTANLLASIVLPGWQVFNIITGH